MANFIFTEEEYDKIKKDQKYSFICRDCGKKVINSSKKSKKWREKQLLFLCRSCAIKYSVKNKYGVDNVFQLSEVKEKSKQSCLKKYGASNYKCSETGKEFFKNYSLEKYGTENPFQSEEVKEKSKKTMLKKDGVDNPNRAEVFKKNIKKTLLKKYGVEHPLQFPAFLKKAKKTLLKKYGTTFPASSKFFYDNYNFDSSWELYYYIYCKDKNINIIREPKELHYKYNNYEYIYQPDFLVENNLVEIKGDYFFENNKLINPYNRLLDSKAEAKQKCMIDNNVLILTSSDILPIIQYVDNKYGKNYINKFRRQNCQITEK